MTDEKTPDPIDDVRRGLGLLFRAARTAVQKLPTGRIEDVVASGAREVGRALENVGRTLEKEIRKAGSAVREGVEASSSGAGAPDTTQPTDTIHDPTHAGSAQPNSGAQPGNAQNSGAQNSGAQPGEPR